MHYHRMKTYYCAIKKKRKKKIETCSSIVLSPTNAKLFNKHNKLDVDDLGTSNFLFGIVRMNNGVARPFINRFYCNFYQIKKIILNLRNIKM